MSESSPGSTTPILAGVYPDPSVLRVGDDFYLACSSFEFFPGIPIWHSRDLVSWTQVGHVIERTSQFAVGTFAPSMGIYAPTLRHHDGRFYVITTAVGGGQGGAAEHLLYSADAPSGPWSDPVSIHGLDGADPDLYWAEDGTCLVSYCAVADGRPLGIHQAAVDLATGQVLEEPRLIWKGTGLQWPEGPHIYQRGDWFYLMIAEGGTDRGHVVCVARSRSERGPFEGAPHNPIFSHRSTDHLVESTGHADLVTTPDGSWASVYLGVRSYGWVPRYHVNGRETFLAGISWQDDWPVFEEEAFEIPTPGHSFADTFQPGQELASRWVSPGAPLAEFVRPAQDGGLLISPAQVESGNVSGLFARPRDRFWTAEVDIAAGSATADFVLRLDERHWYAVRVGDGTATAISRIGDTASTHNSVVTSGTVRLLIRTVAPSRRGPDDVELAVVDAQGEQLLTCLDGRYLSMEVAGGFTGRVLGVVARDGDVLVSRFAYTSN